MSTTSECTGAESVHWNLDDLYRDVSSLRKDLEETAAKARRFGVTYRGKIAQLVPGEINAAMESLADIQDTVGRAFTFVYLNWTTDTGNSEKGALLQEVRESYTGISTELLFFEIEWAALDDETAEATLSAPSSSAFRHYLEIARISRKYILTEPEEKILVEKSITGASAWNRYFDEVIGAQRFELHGGEMSQQEILAKLHDADRGTRQLAAASFTNGLTDANHALTYVFNTILADKATDDRLRGYSSWISSRNLSNEVADESVEALVGAVTGGYDIVARFYELKRRLLGLDEMFEYDRYAPIDESSSMVSWQQARDIVTDAYSDFHSDMGEIVVQFFNNNWIDAAVTQGKRGGAFSHGAVPSVHPYIMVNYTGRLRDVQTLAHELGHGIHQYLSRSQGIFHADTPLTTSETASVFGEMLVFQKMLSNETDDQTRLSMLMGKIDDTIATVFRQVAMNRFEDRIHTRRRETGELSSDLFSDAWMETQREMFGDSVTLTEDYRIWWSYIPHFLHTPGYVYAYAFGELLVLALYDRYKTIGPEFSDKYFTLLSSGGSDWPHRLLEPLGIDLTDPGFWSRGVSAISELVDEAERLANRLQPKA